MIREPYYVQTTKLELSPTQKRVLNQALRIVMFRDLNELTKDLNGNFKLNLEQDEVGDIIEGLIKETA